MSRRISMRKTKSRTPYDSRLRHHTNIEPLSQLEGSASQLVNPMFLQGSSRSDAKPHDHNSATRSIDSITLLDEHQDVSTSHGLPTHPETEEYLRRTLDIPYPQPVDLWALPDDPNILRGKGLISISIKLAIWGSDTKRLTLSQICQSVEERYPSLPGRWRDSIRHNLSLKDIFQQLDVPQSHNSKGKYWVLDIRKGEMRRPSARRTKTTELILDTKPREWNLPVPNFHSGHNHDSHGDQASGDAFAGHPGHTLYITNVRRGELLDRNFFYPDCNVLQPVSSLRWMPDMYKFAWMTGLPTAGAHSVYFGLTVVKGSNSRRMEGF